MRKLFFVIFLIVGLLASVTATAQVNTSCYITLTVKSGAVIKLKFYAATYGTPVRIVSGSNKKNITVGTDWYNNGYSQVLLPLLPVLLR